MNLNILHMKLNRTFILKQFTNLRRVGGDKPGSGASKRKNVDGLKRLNYFTLSPPISAFAAISLVSTDQAPDSGHFPSCRVWHARE